MLFRVPGPLGQIALDSEPCSRVELTGAREQQPTSEGGRYMTTGARGLALAGPKTRHWDAPFASLRLGRAKARPYNTLRRRRTAGEKTRSARGHRAGGSEDPPLQLTGVEGAEIRMAGLSGSAAVLAVGKGERTQRGTVVGAIGGHGSLQKERLDFGIFGGASRRRGALLNTHSLPEE